MPQIRYNRQYGKLFWLSRRRRKLKRYYLRDDAITDALHGQSEPAWKGWSVAILSIITALNTTDLALTGLTGAMGIPFFLNCAFVFINVLVALYLVKNTLVNLVIRPEHRFRNFLKLATQGGIAYGLAIGAIATLAATTPGASLILTLVFVANAVSIGVNLTHTLADIFLPYLQRKSVSIYLKCYGRKPKPIRVPTYLQQRIAATEAYYLQASENKAIFKTIRQEYSEQGQSIEQSTSEQRIQIRARFALFFTAEKQRHERKFLGSTMTRSSEISDCDKHMSRIVKTGSVWSQTTSDAYLDQLKKWVRKLTYEASLVFRLDQQYKQYQNNQSVENAIAVLQNTVFDGRHQPYIELDQLKSGLQLITDNSIKDKNTIRRILTQSVIFDQTPADLPKAIELIYKMAKEAITSKYRKKLKKLHDACGLTHQEIRTALEKRMMSLSDFNPEPARVTSDLFQKDTTQEHAVSIDPQSIKKKPTSIEPVLGEMMDVPTKELEARSKRCPMDDHDCLTKRSISHA